MMKSEGAGEDWITKADAAHPFGRLLRPVDIAKQVSARASYCAERRHNSGVVSGGASSGCPGTR